MSKRLVIGDLHINEVYSEYFRCILFPFLNHVHQNKKYDSVMFVGDVFESSIINNATSRLFKELLSIYNNFPISIINGNHDKITNKESIFDIIILPDNVKFYKDITYEKNVIYLPHIDKNLDHHNIFKNINSYIKTNNIKDTIIYSHNDFNEIYKFKNNFFNVSESFQNIKNSIFLINGHNHVPVYKKKGLFYIFNMGCAINTNFNDSSLNNYFMIVDEEESDFNKKFDLFENKYAIHYHTFHIWNENHIYENCKNINKNNISFVKFKIHDPSVIIDNNFKNILLEKFNIKDIKLDYELDTILKLNYTKTEDSTSLSDLCEKLNIKIEDLNINDTEESLEKQEILFSLLNIMFESRSTSSNDIDKVIETLKKYILK